MAGRVNTRFVIILGVILVLLTGGLVVAYMKLQTTAAENIDLAQSLMAQGDVEAGLEQFGRALNKQPNNVEYILLYLDAAEKQTVDDAHRAQTIVFQVMRGQLEKAAALQPANPEPFRRLMALYQHLGQELGDGGAWTAMYQSAQNTLAARPDSQAARKFRGFAQAYRMSQLDMAEPEREAARDDLRAAMEQDPHDVDVLWAWGLWHIHQAQTIERQGLYPDRLPPLRQEARGTADKLAAMVEPKAVLSAARLRLQLQDQEGAREALAPLEAKLLADPQPVETVVTTAELLVNADRTVVERGPSMAITSRGLQRAQSLIKAALDKSPDDIRLLATYGQILAQQQLNDQAMEYFDKARQASISGPPLRALVASQIQLNADMLYTNLLLNKATALQNVTERDALLKLAKERIDVIAATRGQESPQVNMLQGKLALAQGDWIDATIKLDKASAQFGDSNPELILLSAQARQRAGEPGAAAERLESLLAINPAALPVRLELAKLQVQGKQFAKAAENVQQVLAAQPDNTDALRLQVGLLSQEGKHQAALDTLMKLKPQSDPDLIPSYVQLMTVTGRQQEARNFLDNAFTADPKDLRLLQLLLRSSADKETALGYIEKAKAAGADAEVLDFLALSLQGQDDMASTVESFIDKQTDPFQRAMQRYSLYRQTGKAEAADAALAEAITLKPDNAQVIDIQFSQAVEAQDWPKAETLASRAGALNLDQAGGMFYQGQLALARRNFSAAVANFRRGVGARPVFSEGWRQLGDAQRMAGDNIEALTSYRKAVDQRPNNVSALRGMAAVLASQGQFPQALDALRQAVANAPNDRGLLESYLSFEETQGDANRALTLRRQIAAANPADLNNRRSIAVILARQEKAKLAQETINEIIATDGRNLANIAALAQVYAVSGDVPAARNVLEGYVNDLGDNATVQDWVVLAKFFLSLGLDDDALQAFRKATAIEDPQTRPASRELADILFDRGLFENALEYYQKLYEAAPSDQVVAKRYVEALLRSGNTDLADTVLQKLDVDDATTQVLRGLVARERGQDAKALAAFEAAVKSAPNRALLYYQWAEQFAREPGRERQALEKLDRAVELEPNLIPARMLRVQMNLQRHDVAEAVRQLELLLKDTPRYVPARTLLAQLYQTQGAEAPLATLLENSLELFPQDTRWHRLQARQALRQGRGADAIKKLEDAVAISASPENVAELAVTLLNAKQLAKAAALLAKHDEMVQRNPYLTAVNGRLLSAQGKPDEAKAAFVRAFEPRLQRAAVGAIAEMTVTALGIDEALTLLQPVTLGVNGTEVSLAIAGLLIKEERFDQAMERLKVIEPLLKDDIEGREMADRFIAMSLHSMGEFQQAKAIYDRILARDPRNVAALNNLAYLLTEDLNQAVAGLRLAEQALTIAPEDAQVLDTLGWAQHRAGRSGDARRTLGRSVEIMDLPANHYHLAIVLEETGGDRRLVVQHLEAAIKAAKQYKDTKILTQATARLETLKN